MSLMKGKKFLIFGIASNRSIAYGIAKQLKADGAEIGISYGRASLEKHVRPLAEELGVNFFEECDLSEDNAIKNLLEKSKDYFGKLDGIVHSVAFAPKEALSGRYIDTKKADFMTAMNISVYSLVAIAKEFEDIMNENSSFITMSYFGAEKVISNYNVMGVAKSALESTVRYLSVDLGVKGIRVNAISAGPVRTLASSGISGFSSILSLSEEKNPLKRNIDIEDCGNLASFLLSEKSKNITGEVIHLDAGYNIMGF